jgi:hypothetical protein
MANHGRLGEYDYVIDVTKMEKLAGKYLYVAKITELTNRRHGTLDTVQFGEHYGDTAREAEDEAHCAVKTWIREQGSN